MASLAKKISESVLSSLANDLKPDIPAHNRLKRSWAELEKKKFTRTQQLRHNKEQIAARTQHSIQTLSKAERAPSVHEDVQGAFSKNCIPGFRYRANGDAKPSAEEARKEAIMRSLKGLSRHVFEKKSTQKSKSMVTHQHPPTDIVLSGISGHTEPPELPTRKHVINRPFGIVDDDSDLRVRKVQEQLGLCRHQGPGTLDSDKTISMHTLDHFKALHFPLRSSEVDIEVGRSLSSKSSSRRKRMANTARAGVSQTNSDAASSTVSSFTSMRDRCGACRFMARSEVMELVQSSSSTALAKPRWRHSPSGRYVPPPLNTLRIANPTLYRHAIGNREEKINTMYDMPTSKNASFLACDSLQSGKNDKRGSSNPSLITLRKKNSQRAEALEEKMQKFLNSLPVRSSRVSQSARL